MRGRTNVTQRAVPYVNGEVITAEVGEGSVGVGDFVDYVLKEQNEMISSDFVSFSSHPKNSNILKIKEDTFIYYLNDVLYLISINNFYNELDKITTGFFCLLNNGKLLLRSENNTKQLDLYEIINDKFNFIKSFNTEQTGYNFIQMENGKIIILNSNQVHIYNYDSDLDDLNFEKTFTCNVTGYSYLGNICLGGQDNSIIVVNPSYYLGGNYYGYVVGIDEDENIQTLNYRSYLNSINGFIGLSNGSISSLQLGYQGTSIAPFFKTFKFVNNVLTELVSINPNSITPSNVSNNDICGSTIILNKESILNLVAGYDSTNKITKAKFIIYKLKNGIIEEISNLVELNIDNNSASSGLGTGYAFLNSKNEIFYVWRGLKKDVQGTYVLKFIYENGILSLGGKTEFIKQYSGSNAIGFTKTSGKQGDQIKVYIPKTT